MNRCRNIEEMAQKLTSPPRATLADAAEGAAAAGWPKGARPQVLIESAAAAKRTSEKK